MTNAKPDEPEIKLQNNWLLQGSLGVLLAIAIWFIFARMWNQQQFLRLAVFLGAGVLYITLTAGFLHRFFTPRKYRGYFLYQFLILAVMMFAAPPSANLWFLVLPAASQAMMFLPLREIPLVLLSHVALGFAPMLIEPRHLLGSAINFLSAFLFTLGCSYAIRRELDSRRELHAAHEKLRAYSEKAEALAAAEERARLAREIHDGVAHHLMAANVLVEAGVALLPAAAPSAAIDSLQKGQGQIRSALAELRASISERQYTSHDQELAGRILTLIASGNFPASLHTEGAVRRLAPEAEQAFFRLAQEALTNARKHAPSSTIDLLLDFSDPSRTVLSVKNEEPPQTASGDGAFGLLSLRERMQRLGGHFNAGPDNAGLFVVRGEIPA